MPNAILVDPGDNVVVVIEAVEAGALITYTQAGQTRQLPARQPIPIYHKAARCDIAAGAPVCKYGQHIGLAACDIAAGEHVHLHNVMSHREVLE